MERQFLDDGILTFSPLSASTARCEVASHLFPTNNLTTSGDAFCINGIQEAISKAYARARKFLVGHRACYIYIYANRTWFRKEATCERRFIYYYLVGMKWIELAQDRRIIVTVMKAGFQSRRKFLDRLLDKDAVPRSYLRLVTIT